VMTRLREVARGEFRCTCSTNDNDGRYRGISHEYSNAVRRDATFSTLRELEKKVCWAESMGLLLPTNTNYTHNPRPKRTACGFHPLPTSTPSNYLRPGTFLIAHPLLTGCFSRTVISILEHTQPSYTPNDNNDDDDVICTEPGGTYGIIINRMHTKSIPNDTNARPSRLRKNRTLQEVMQHNCLPEGLRVAFGDVAVRDGGPVNLSLQMVRCASVEEEEGVRIGGAVLPMVVIDEKEEGPMPVSQAKDGDGAVYFGGDVIKAAQAVIDGEIEKENFSFLVGASCWEYGQLESEISRGYWLPCRGPPQTTFTGTCDHQLYDAESDEDEDEDNCGGGCTTEELWRSTMCALGEGEGDLAYLMSDDEEEDGEVYDENGLACDAF